MEIVECVHPSGIPPTFWRWQCLWSFTIPVHVDPILDASSCRTHHGVGGSPYMLPGSRTAQGLPDFNLPDDVLAAWCRYCCGHRMTPYPSGSRFVLVCINLLVGVSPIQISAAAWTWEVPRRRTRDDRHPRCASIPPVAPGQCVQRRTDSHLESVRRRLLPDIAAGGHRGA